jgi:hypothetical protein
MPQGDPFQDDAWDTIMQWLYARIPETRGRLEMRQNASYTPFSHTFAINLNTMYSAYRRRGWLRRMGRRLSGWLGAGR